MVISRRSLLLAGAAFPASAYAQCVTDRFAVDACRGGVHITGPSTPPGATLDLSFLTPGTLDPRITFTRASTATYTDASGVVQTAAVNAPRWDYDPVTHALRGLLLEDQRTNSVFPGIPAAGWSLTNITFVQSAGTAPDGSNSFVKIAETATTGPHYSIAPGLQTLVASQPYVFSVHARAGENRYLELVFDNNASVGTNATFDLLTGTVTGPAANVGGSTGSLATIRALGGGVYRCAVTSNLGANTSGRIAVQNSIVATPAGQFGGNAYTGVAGNGVYVWGAQFEQGDTPTSYIATTSGSVVRNIDSCLVPSANMAWFTSPGGSWFAEFMFTAAAPSNSRIIGRPDTAGGVSPLLLTATRTCSQNDGASVATANAGAANAVTKGVSTWASGQATVCLNGGAVASSAALATGYGVFTTSGVRFLSVGAALSGDNTSGWLRRVSYWPRVLSDTEMQQVTT